MKTWMLGGLLTAVTGSGISFVVAGAGNPSHCGPCSACRAIPTPEPMPEVDARSEVPPPGLFVRPKAAISFDEPPLAKPLVRPNAVIVPATYVEPAASSEPAPRPRPLDRSTPLATPNDPF